jgi:hypothetical protein
VEPSLALRFNGIAATGGGWGSKVICRDGACAFDGSKPGLTLMTEFDRDWNPSRPSVPLDPDGMCSVYFTSGSTKNSKAIADHRQDVNHIIK